jgi:protein-L-isoaspartate(D-aspartate) O-methyltransferase
MRAHAYNDEPLPIGDGQTISQPYIVAYMTEMLQPRSSDTILEIGTGSGYQTAVLAEMAAQVYSIEILASLSIPAQKTLHKLGYKNIHFKIGDGSKGWDEYAPYNRIMVTAAPARVPETLLEQLKIEGKMIIPVGATFQELVLIIRGKRKNKKKSLIPVRFVPLITEV